MPTRRDPEAAAKRHERFVEKFAQLERDREAKRRRVDTPQAYSPLELQVLELKRKHPGVLLAIEVGYKFRFFGEDAKVMKDKWGGDYNDQETSIDMFIVVVVV